MENKSYKSGVLLHPTALPGPWGMGELGPNAYKFVDDLAKMGQSYWQILPLGPLDNTFSPYSLLSTFAGNPLLISFDKLMDEGLLLENEIDDFSSCDHSRINFEFVKQKRMKVLFTMCSSFLNRANEHLIADYYEFLESNKNWLDDFSQYSALRKLNNRNCWTEWDKNLVPGEREFNNEKILQFLFHYQWHQLREYCHSIGILIIGDMPIYVSHDSSDVWANTQLFQLDENGNKQFQAGSPPCDFQENGQIWRNPLYNWSEHEKTEFEWWKERVEQLLKMVDIIRFDHFIGYVNYWRIPEHEDSAKNGEWVSAPGNLLLYQLFNEFTDMKIIAEDLGDVSPKVTDLREKFNLPGMRVLQFEFGETIHSPELYPHNSVAYTGTHDNDTILGWFSSLSISNQKKVRENLLSSETPIHFQFIDHLQKSGSKLVIFPIQDILGLDTKSRFNKPGTLSNENWSWRLMESHLTNEVKSKIRELTENNNRVVQVESLEVEL